MLKVENLSIHFGGLIAVNNLSFGIAKGEVLGLIGPNGAGKTTCFHIISGALSPTSGKVYLNGREIQGQPMFQINKAGIARTYQNINLFQEASVLQNVMAGYQSHLHSGLLSSILRLPRQRREEKEAVTIAREMLSFVGLTYREQEHARSLPYGEQRLLEIARALAGKPALLLLDEPAAGMNPSEKAQLSGLVSKIRDSGVTVLVVEHDMKFVMGLADRICVLNYGEKIAIGTPVQVQQDPKVIEAYLGGGASG